MNEYTVSTQITSESVGSDYLYIATGPSWRTQTTSVYAPYANLVIARGVYASIDEQGTSTEFDIVLKDISGNTYKISLSTCNPTGEEYKLYLGTSLIKAVETGCKSGGTQLGGVATNGTALPDGVVGTTINGLIKYVEIIPVGGDNGRTVLSLYLYVPDLPYTIPDGVSISVLSG